MPCGHGVVHSGPWQITGEVIMSATTTTTDIDIDALKTRLRATWMDGNYDYFSRFMQSSAAEFLDRLDVRPGATLLDVACGSGQLALIAARRGVRVTGVDIATNSIVAARGRATSEGLDVRFDEGDAEALPYPDGSFDVVASIYGAMFAPRPDASRRRYCACAARAERLRWATGRRKASSDRCSRPLPGSSRRPAPAPVSGRRDRRA